MAPGVTAEAGPGAARRPDRDLGERPPLGVAAGAYHDVPGLAAFLPDRRLVPPAPDLSCLRLPDDPAIRAGDWVAAEGPFRAPAFGRLRAPLALVVAVAEAPGPLDPVAAALRAVPRTVSADASLLAELQALAWPGIDLAAAAALLAATRWRDPFHDRPWSAAEGLAQLAAWRAEAAARGRIVACTGIEWFKHRRVLHALAGEAGSPAIVMCGSTAIRRARAAGGAAGVWSAVMPAALPARAAAAGVPLVRIEDGFLRSAGLGVHLVPAAGLVRDEHGIHYDPRQPSGLERLLAEREFDAALLDRAARLRQAILAANLTKYNLAGDAAGITRPAGRRVILVPGQVEDDAAMRNSGARLASNLGLLQAVRAAEPEACIWYKPHPDVAAGMRRGALPEDEEARLADAVVAAPIAALYPLVDAVHTIGSLAGFEALLRGIPVTTWGRPFYAGWGLTEDRDPPPGRGRRLTLDMLVAAALILYQRSIDPVTGLPCEPELLVERFAAAHETAGPARRPFGPAWGRALIARCSRAMAGIWAGL